MNTKDKLKATKTLKTTTIDLISKKTTLHVQHTFFLISKKTTLHVQQFFFCTFPYHFLTVAGALRERELRYHNNNTDMNPELL